MVPNRSASTLGLALSVFISAATGQTKDAVECEATLIGYQVRHRWTAWDENGETMFITPFATFRIEEPIEFEGRTVRVYFLTDEYDQILAELRDDTGGRYKLKLPADYFDGRDGLIIRDDSIHSIEPKEKSKGSSSQALGSQR